MASTQFFWRGNLQNDREPTPPAFPGQPPQSTALANNKGFAVGYTFLISSNLVNDVRYGLTREGEDTAGASNELDHLTSPKSRNR